jgi:hypothetical protein
VDKMWKLVFSCKQAVVVTWQPHQH